VWAPKCACDPKICMHECMPIIWIVAHGGTCRGDKNVHDMHACLLHSRAWVRDCVVDKRALMRACGHDRGAWRCPYRVGRRAHMRTCGMDRRT
jgi:hypothetical protein